jgi:hypothetical protein
MCAIPLLGKGGVAATINKNIAKPPNTGADGVVRSATDYRMLIEPPRLRAGKVASHYFVDARSHPSFAKEGNRPTPTCDLLRKGIARTQLPLP